jgi:GTP:adenosylcobinamide-phosphate guanylyltransferase
MHTCDPLCVSSDLPGVNPATLNRVILYYHLMTKWSGLLGESTELCWMGLSQLVSKDLYAPE